MFLRKKSGQKNIKNYQRKYLCQFQVHKLTFCVIGQRKYQLDVGYEIIMLVTFSMLEINEIFDTMVQLLNFRKLTWNFPYLKITAFELWRGQYVLLIVLHNQKI